MARWSSIAPAASALSTMVPTAVMASPTLRVPSAARGAVVAGGAEVAGVVGGVEVGGAVVAGAGLLPPECFGPAFPFGSSPPSSVGRNAASRNRPTTAAITGIHHRERRGGAAWRRVAGVVGSTAVRSGGTALGCAATAAMGRVAPGCRPAPTAASSAAAICAASAYRASGSFCMARTTTASSAGGISGTDRGRRLRVLEHVLRGDRERGVGHERHPPGKHLVQHHAERVDVRAAVDPIAPGPAPARGTRPSRTPSTPA